MPIERSKPNLLIYAHYYPPDVASTGQLLKELAEGMLDSFNITVICVVPSYTGIVEEKYKEKKYYFENINGVKTIRVRVPDFKKAQKISRVKNILAYSLRAMWATFKVKEIDYVYSISQPPILGGLLGVWGKWMKRAKFIYNIQDFNPEQIIATGYSKNHLLLKLMMGLDKFSCGRADKVIVVGRDMVDTLKKRFGGKKLPKYAFINNWTDEKEIYPLPLEDPHVAAFREKYGLSGKFVFMYSGNLGLYYDLENLMRVIKKFPQDIKTPDGREVVFAFVGAGSIYEKLIKYKEEQYLNNAVFVPYQDKLELNYSLNAADVHWCVSAKGIKGVSCPSKFYSIIATGKAVLGAMEKGAECRLILEEAHCGLVCEPGDYEQIEKNIRWYIENAGTDMIVEIGMRGRTFLKEYLAKDTSIARYINEIQRG